MPRTLYIVDPSAPARSVWMLCKTLGIDVEIKKVDLMNDEQMQDWFLKINPNHCVPTLDDGGFYLWESRAIMRYLVNAYVPESDLYPKDPKKRAVVDRALDRDLGVVYKNIGAIIYPTVFMGQPDQDTKDVCSMLTALETKTPLAEGKYIAGDTMTIADISTVNSVTFLECVEFDFSPYPNVLAWIKKMKELPHHAEVNAGFEHFKGFIKTDEFKKMMKDRMEKNK